jgi:oligosaccharide repeat unit polymerase
LVYIFIGLGTIGIVIKWGILLDMYETVPRAVSNVNVVRARAVRGEFSYPTVSRILVLFLFPSLLFTTFLSRKRPRYLSVVLYVLFLLFLDDLSIAARGHTAFGFSIVAVGYLVTVVADPDGSLRNNVKLMIGATILALLSINLIFAIRSGFDGSVISYILVSFKSIYRYAVGPLPAFSWILPQRSLSGYPGAYTFGGAYRIINYLAEPILAIKPFPRPPKPDARIPLGFNTFPHLWALYSDFGLAGMLGLLFGFGALSSYIYSHFLAKPTLLNHVVISNTLIFIVWTPRDVTTFWVSYWVTLLASVFIAYFIDNQISSVSD